MSTTISVSNAWPSIGSHRLFSQWPFASSSSSLSASNAQHEQQQQASSYKRSINEQQHMNQQRPMMEQQFHYFYNHDRMDPNTLASAVGTILNEARQQQYKQPRVSAAARRVMNVPNNNNGNHGNNGKSNAADSDPAKSFLASYLANQWHSRLLAQLGAHNQMQARSQFDYWPHIDGVSQLSALQQSHQHQVQASPTQQQHFTSNSPANWAMAASMRAPTVMVPPPQPPAMHAAMAGAFPVPVLGPIALPPTLMSTATTATGNPTTSANARSTRSNFQNSLGSLGAASHVPPPTIVAPPTGAALNLMPQMSQMAPISHMSQSPHMPLMPLTVPAISTMPTLTALPMTRQLPALMALWAQHVQQQQQQQMKHLKLKKRQSGNNSVNQLLFKTTTSDSQMKSQSVNESSAQTSADTEAGIDNESSEFGQVPAGQRRLKKRSVMWTPSGTTNHTNLDRDQDRKRTTLESAIRSGASDAIASTSPALRLSSRWRSVSSTNSPAKSYASLMAESMQASNIEPMFGRQMAPKHSKIQQPERRSTAWSAPNSKKSAPTTAVPASAATVIPSTSSSAPAAAVNVLLLSGSGESHVPNSGVTGWEPSRQQPQQQFSSNPRTSSVTTTGGSKWAHNQNHSSHSSKWSARQSRSGPIILAGVPRFMSRSTTASGSVSSALDTTQSVSWNASNSSSSGGTNQSMAPTTSSSTPAPPVQGLQLNDAGATNAATPTTVVTPSGSHTITKKAQSSQHTLIQSAQQSQLPLSESMAASTRVANYFANVESERVTRGHPQAQAQPQQVSSGLLATGALSGSGAVGDSNSVGGAGASVHKRARRPSDAASGKGGSGTASRSPTNSAQHSSSTIAAKHLSWSVPNTLQATLASSGSASGGASSAAHAGTEPSSSVVSSVRSTSGAGGAGSPAAAASMDVASESADSPGSDSATNSYQQQQLAQSDDGRQNTLAMYGQNYKQSADYGTTPATPSAGSYRQHVYDTLASARAPSNSFMMSQAGTNSGSNYDSNYYQSSAAYQPRGQQQQEQQQLVLSTNNNYQQQQQQSPDYNSMNGQQMMSLSMIGAQQGQPNGQYSSSSDSSSMGHQQQTNSDQFGTHNSLDTSTGSTAMHDNSGGANSMDATSSSAADQQQLLAEHYAQQRQSATTSMMEPFGARHPSSSVLGATDSMDDTGTGGAWVQPPPSSSSSSFGNSLGSHSPHSQQYLSGLASATEPLASSGFSGAHNDQQAGDYSQSHFGPQYNSELTASVYHGQQQPMSGGNNQRHQASFDAAIGAHQRSAQHQFMLPHQHNSASYHSGSYNNNNNNLQQQLNEQLGGAGSSSPFQSSSSSAFRNPLIDEDATAATAAAAGVATYPSQVQLAAMRNAAAHHQLLMAGDTARASTSAGSSGGAPEVTPITSHHYHFGTGPPASLTPFEDPDNPYGALIHDLATMGVSKRPTPASNNQNKKQKANNNNQGDQGEQETSDAQSGGGNKKGRRLLQRLSLRRWFRKLRKNKDNKDKDKEKEKENDNEDKDKENSNNEISNNNSAASDSFYGPMPYDRRARRRSRRSTLASLTGAGQALTAHHHHHHLHAPLAATSPHYDDQYDAAQHAYAQAARQQQQQQLIEQRFSDLSPSSAAGDPLMGSRNFEIMLGGVLNGSGRGGSAQSIERSLDASAVVAGASRLLFHNTWSHHNPQLHLSQAPVDTQTHAHDDDDEHHHHHHHHHHNYDTSQHEDEPLVRAVRLFGFQGFDQPVVVSESVDMPTNQSKAASRPHDPPIVAQMVRRPMTSVASSNNRQ
ncbi:hypothetical protein GZH46_02939, partial [Fragariocoptes setiger]